MFKKKLTSIAMLILAGSTLSGCELVGQAKLTGGGTMNSAGGDKNAVFTFNATKCDEEEVSGQVNYQDLSAIDFETIGGVALRADITNVGFCTSSLEALAEGKAECSCDGQYEAQFTYNSKNPGAPGEGTGHVCFFDTGEGKGNFHGAITALSLSGGPYNGYFNSGTINGNLQSHSCPGEKE